MSTNKSFSNKKYSNKSPVNSKSSNKLFLLPLIAVSAILPFIMYLYYYDTNLSGFSWFSNDDAKFDVFLYYKQTFLIIVSCIMVLLVLYKVFVNKMQLHIVSAIVPLLLYGLLAFLSTLFSKYSSYGYSGTYEQFESIFAILGYCIIVYYAFLFIKTEEDVRFVLKYLLISILVFCILGLTQITGYDLLATDFGKKLYVPKTYWDQLSEFAFTFGKHRVYLTLYNPNYVGVYVSLIIPFLIGLLITERNKKKIALYILAILGMVVCLIGSESKTSVLCILVSLVFTAIFFRKYLFRKTRYTIPVLAAVVVAAVLFTVLNIGFIKNTFHSITNIEKSNPNLTSIQTDDNSISITYKENTFSISMLQGSSNLSIVLLDADSNSLDYTLDESTRIMTITDERFAGIQIQPVSYNDMVCLAVTIDGRQWGFTNQTGDNTYYHINSAGKYDKIVTADSVLFTGYETFASGRGYIWSRTIPLLKKYLFLGSGADTFSIVFPHEDYVNSYNAGFDGQFITRPHNLYLQIGVQSGVLSLIAFLAFYILYFISSFRLYIKGKFDTYFHRAGVAIFLGTIAYMIAGITNDSTINVAPVFWTLIGIGTAINAKLTLDTYKNSDEGKAKNAKENKDRIETKM